ASDRAQPRDDRARQRRQHGRLRNARRPAIARRLRLHDRTRRLLRRFRRSDGNQHGRRPARRGGHRTAADRDSGTRLGGSMSTRKTTLFYALLLMTASLFVGMVIASRLDLAPRSSAQTIAVPAMNSAPITGPLDAQTFRNVAKMANPIVVNIRTEMKAKNQDMSDFLGGGSPDDLFHRFFGPGGGQQDDQTP